MNRILRYIAALLSFIALASVPAKAAVSMLVPPPEATPDTILMEYDPVELEEILPQELRAICNDTLSETAQLGVVVLDAETGQTLFSHHPHYRLRPASCQKLVTAIAALSEMGADWAVNTDLYITGEVGEDSVLHGDVYVVGRMDPLLSRGDVYRLALSLRNQGITSIEGNLYADISHCDSTALGGGWCWDDPWGPLRALTVDGKDRFRSEFVTDLDQAGIVMAVPALYYRTRPADARLVARAQHTVAQILPRMMKKSDNIFAESLFYQLAALNGKPWAGRRAASARINRLISEQTTVSTNDYVVADGSGLSLYNYLTPDLLTQLLQYAWHMPRIRAALLPVLPVAGVDGTLEKRLCGTEAEGRIRAKTGTVTGVSTLAGYALRPDGRTLTFAIMCQGVRSSNEGKAFQDRICRVLCR